MLKFLNIPERPWTHVKPMKNIKSPASPTVPKCFRLSDDVREVIQKHLDEVGTDGRRFRYSIEDQDAALEIIDYLGVHIPHFSVRDAQSKWSVVQTDPNTVQWKDDKTRKHTRYTRYYLCACATDHTSGSHHAATKRQIAWENVGCIAWLKMVTTHDDEDKLLTIDEISGIFDHTEACKNTITTPIIPRIPLHPDLRDFALKLLHQHIPLTQLQQSCRDFAKKRWGDLPGDNSHRYFLGERDTTSLYRSQRREMGIPQRTLPEDNLDAWFRSSNPKPPTSALTDSLIHYQPHVPGQTERFELILSTPDQRRLAWQFGHKRQLLMDGTFGVCTARVLLFILMVIDDQSHGIPIAFILFTAKKEHTAVHASYDGALLEVLIGKFKSAMGRNEAGEEFDILVANTDNDSREQFALTTHFPSILLLLCLFHIWQSWKNALNHHLRIIPKGPPRQQIRRDLGLLLVRLLKEITIYRNALTAYNATVIHYRYLSSHADSEVSKKQSQGALSFLAYLQGFLKSQSYWQMWSASGVELAAQRLNIPTEKVVRTTNHLESFNGRLKRKYFSAYQNSGRLPRIDVWVLVLVQTVIPQILEERHARQANSNFRSSLKTGKGIRPARRLDFTSTTDSDISGPDSLSDTSESASSATSDPNSEASSDQDLLADLEANACEDDEIPFDESNIPEGYDSLLHIEPESSTEDTIGMPHELELITASFAGLDAALDASQILPNLPDQTNHTVSSSGSNLSSSAQDAIAAAPLPSVKTRHDNLVAIAWRELLVHEDGVRDSVQRLLALGVDHSLLDAHISPAVRRASDLSGDLACEPAQNPPVKISISPGVCLPDSDDDDNGPVIRELQGFSIQRKERRKESYNCR